MHRSTVPRHVAAKTIPVKGKSQPCLILHNYEFISTADPLVYSFNCHLLKNWRTMTNNFVLLPLQCIAMLSFAIPGSHLFSSMPACMPTPLRLFCSLQLTRRHHCRKICPACIDLHYLPCSIWVSHHSSLLPSFNQTHENQFCMWRNATLIKSEGRCSAMCLRSTAWVSVPNLADEWLFCIRVCDSDPRLFFHGVAKMLCGLGGAVEMDVLDVLQLGRLLDFLSRMCCPCKRRIQPFWKKRC